MYTCADLQEQTPKDPNVELKSDVEKDMKACLGLRYNPSPPDIGCMIIYLYRYIIMWRKYI